MRVSILSFGKIKTPGLRETADHYLRLFRSWPTQIEEVELKAAGLADKSHASRVLAQEAEAKALESWIEKTAGAHSVLILLDETGELRTTKEWAGWVEEQGNRGHSHLIFCIGGSMGFSAGIKSRARALFSLGPQTLAHDLARVILLEQLDRAFSVIHRHPYHHEG